jgi:hypothetical protein
LSAGGVYEAASSPVPAFQVFKPTDLFTVNLPEGAIESAHIVFGVGALPSLPVVGGVPQQPDPIIETVTYDFVEFTHDGTDTLFANTTMIDQFGLPIRIQIQPACLPLPNGAGVTTSLVDTYHAYVAYVSAPGPDFLQCSRNAFRTPVAAGPRRIVSPKYAIEGYCIRGLEVALSPSTGSTLTGNLYYAVTAVDGNGNETYRE